MISPHRHHCGGQSYSCESATVRTIGTFCTQNEVKRRFAIWTSQTLKLWSMQIPFVFLSLFEKCMLLLLFFAGDGCWIIYIHSSLYLRLGLCRNFFMVMKISDSWHHREGSVSSATPPKNILNLDIIFRCDLWFV